MIQEQQRQYPFNNADETPTPSLEQVLAHLRSLDDPHVRDIGERWSEIRPDDVRMYERYTQLQARFNDNERHALADEFFADVQTLSREFQARRQASSSLRPDDPTAIFLAMLGTKLGALDLECQRYQYRKRKPAVKRPVVS